MSTVINLIVNPSAGGGRARKALGQIKKALEAENAPYEVNETRNLEHAHELAVLAADNGQIAGAVGGDGLVGAVASGAAESGGLMAILPGGRGNDLARHLNIPTDPAQAVAIALHGLEGKMDLGDCNGKSFCCIASCGFDSDANRIANETWIPGSLSYLYAAIKALIYWKPAVFTVTRDGEPKTFEGYSVVAANSKAYGGGMFIAPEADVTDGLLDTVTISKQSKLRYLSLLPTVFKGKHIELDPVEMGRAERVEISADRPFTVYADGDPLCDLPVVVTVRRNAVRIMLPPVS